jgi:hypothetical protein
MRRLRRYLTVILLTLGLGLVGTTFACSGSLVSGLIGGGAVLLFASLITLISLFGAGCRGRGCSPFGPCLSIEPAKQEDAGARRGSRVGPCLSVVAPPRPDAGQPPMTPSCLSVSPLKRRDGGGPSSSRVVPIDGRQEPMAAAESAPRTLHLEAERAHALARHSVALPVDVVARARRHWAAEGS